MNGTMESSRSPRTPSVREIFLEALSKPAVAERNAWLDSVCLGKPELRARVEALLRSHRDDNFLEEPSIRLEGAAPAQNESDVSPMIGTCVDCYKLEERIGEGGMGVVYMAEQMEPVRRKVALKIIKLGMDTRQVVARFEAERQALALMDHPHIAKILDAGATDRGRPYFVMELVQGVPITRFCDENRLAPGERIKLFMLVCRAVQSAHQKGVIHRDLKPSNVLVTLNAGVPHPMVIDFGVAKATNQKLTKKTLFTNFATMIGTPAYISPEQAEMSKLDVDTRSDIYSLGVLLYELLTSSTPFPETRLRSVSYGEMQRIITEEEPERPSTRLRKMTKAPRAPALENSALRTAHSAIDPDLDWIVMKCLEKDRDRRYETANGLVADLQRHLNNEAILARPPSATYRFKKLVRRNKLVFGASAVVVLALIGSVTMSSWQAARANRERARAERRLTATLSFLESVFSDVSEKLQKLVGGAATSEFLNTNGMSLMAELRREADANPKFDFTLGKLYTQIGMGHGSIGGNTSGNYDASYNASTQAIALFAALGDTVPQDERARRLARAEMVAGFAAMALRRPEQALVHFQEMGKWADLTALSDAPELKAEGTKLRRWAGGCTGEALEALGKTEKALRDYYLPGLRELQSRNVSDQSENWTDLHDLVAANSTIGRAYNSLGQFGEASNYLRQAHHALGVMQSRFPNDAQIAAEHSLAEQYSASCRAGLGERQFCRTSNQDCPALRTWFGRMVLRRFSFLTGASRTREERSTTSCARRDFVESAASPISAQLAGHGNGRRPQGSHRRKSEAGIDRQRSDGNPARWQMSRAPLSPGELAHPPPEAQLTVR
jgi:serine/threonine protein kinase